MLSSTSALAHLRVGVALTGAEALAELVADARGRELSLFYFTSGAYSETALTYAERFGIALFSFDEAGLVSHANPAAMAAVLAAPDRAVPSEDPGKGRSDTSLSGGALPSVAHEPDLPAWAGSAWQARRAATPRWALLAYLPLGAALVVGLLALHLLRAWQTSPGTTTSLGPVVVALVAFHAFCVWGVLLVARRRGRLRRHRLHVLRACTPPDQARALVHRAMHQSGRGVPHDREALVLLRNEVIALSGLDAFTAAVLVWEVTIGAARPAELREWLGAPPGGHPAAS